MATTASLPRGDTTVSLTLPFWMSKTASAGSPWEKIISVLLVVLKRPAFSNLGQEDFGIESLLLFRFHWWPPSRIHDPLLGGLCHGPSEASTTPQPFCDCVHF